MDDYIIEREPTTLDDLNFKLDNIEGTLLETNDILRDILSELEESSKIQGTQGFGLTQIVFGIVTILIVFVIAFLVVTFIGHIF